MLIKTLRKEAGLTQGELADRIGITAAGVSALELGKNNAKSSTLKLLAQTFGVKVESLLANTAPEFEILGALEDLEYITLPFVPFTAYGSFVAGCHQDTDFSQFGTVRVLRIPGKDYVNAVVIEVRGNSMAPRYPDQSRHVARRVQDGNWQYATGVHALSLRSEMFLIKKITANVGGLLTLTSTNGGDTMTVELGDLNCLWKVGEASYMPEED